VLQLNSHCPGRPRTASHLTSPSGKNIAQWRMNCCAMGDDCDYNSTFSISYPTRPGQRTNIIVVRTGRASFLPLSQPRNLAAENVASMPQLLDLPPEIFQRTIGVLVKKHGIPAAWRALGASRKYQYNNSKRDIRD